jgi:8-oxo-dGTP pyrophosphatase MutT (NUDIX family)
MTAPPTIEIDRSPRDHPAEMHTHIKAAWRQLCDQNPRYFNGGMLAFDSYDPSTNIIHSHAEEYKHHAVRDTVDLGVSLLAVTGVLAARDYEHTKYMLGKRSPTTHRYGDLWEFGPCGGVDVPTKPITTLGPDAILGELQREAIEEAGIRFTEVSPVSLGLVHDDAVGSVDIVLRVPLDTIPKTHSSWEYTECMWLTISELNERLHSHPNEFIPTAHAIAGMLSRRADYD